MLCTVITFIHSAFVETDCRQRLIDIRASHTDAISNTHEQIMVIRLCQDNALPRYDHREFLFGV